MDAETLKILDRLNEEKLDELVRDFVLYLEFKTGVWLGDSLPRRIGFYPLMSAEDHKKSKQAQSECKMIEAREAWCDWWRPLTYPGVGSNARGRMPEWEGSFIG